VASAEIVDDHALMAVADALVSARLPADAKTRALLREICGLLDHSSTWGFYAKLWVLSKYGTSAELTRLVESSRSIWVTEEHISRLVGGLYPRLIGSSHQQKFAALIRRAGTPWSRTVLEFHEGLSTERTAFSSIRKFLYAP